MQPARVGPPFTGIVYLRFDSFIAECPSAMNRYRAVRLMPDSHPFSAASLNYDE